MQQRFQEPDAKTTVAQSQTDSDSIVEREFEHQTETAECSAEIATQQSDTVSSSLQQATREASKWRKRRRRVLGISVAMVPLAFICMSISIPLRNSGPFLLGFFLVLAGLIGLLFGILMRPLRGNPVVDLWQSDDVQAIGPLLESTQMLLPELKDNAIDGLIRLLPRLQACETPLLTAYQRSCLRRLLAAHPVDEPNYQALALEGIPPQQIEAMRTFYQDRIGNERTLAVVLLNALEHLGTGADVDVVRKLAAGEGMAGKDSEVLNAAQACLPLLLARAEQERSSQTYLRAAGEPAASHDVLLRAAEGVAPSDPDQLLRSSDTQSP